MMKRFLKRLSFSLSICSFIFFGQFSTTTFAAEGDTYSFSWLDPDKEVFVLQNRKFRKAGRLHLNIGAGLTTSGAFVDSTAFQGRAGYFFQEEFGFEVVYSLNSGEENSTAQTLRNKGGAGSVPFRRIVDSYMGGMLLWSPFYAKINTFNTIIYLDWIIGAGVAKLEETNNLIEFRGTAANDPGTTLSHTGIMWDTGLKFYLNQNFDVRMDLTVVHYKADRAVQTGDGESTYYSNWDLAFSLGYSF